MSVKARFMSPNGKFQTIKEEVFPTSQAALEAAKEHYTPLGFKDFRIIQDVEDDGLRITAKTPGGRSGRNVVFLDWEIEE